jgi:hypothetical protein
MTLCGCGRITKGEGSFSASNPFVDTNENNMHRANDKKRFFFILK